MSVTIFWFRRDLRIDDNVGLFNALNGKEKVIPIFIFDEDILNNLEKTDHRVTFIYEQLAKINTKLKKINSSLAIFYGKPEEVLNKLTTELEIKAVYTNHDYEPYAIKRDNQIKAFLKEKQIDFKTFKDQVIFETNEVVKADGLPYLVYTPYSRKWISLLNEEKLIESGSDKLLNNLAPHNYPFLSLKDLGMEESVIKVKGYSVESNLINSYEETRNFPSVEGTSNISPHLRFGTVSIRKIVKLALESKNETFLKELIWREFFMQILWHFPHTTNKCFKSKYDSIEWLNNPTDFKNWCKGETGYPIVDAGMRQLNETGYMHNRVRMVVASFLCKHLLVDWRWGESYFANKLFDYEQASNIGNWQWVAGCGVDAAPYFRIFNPMEQLKKFDANLKYTKFWVKDLQESSYPKPILEHVFARQRCLETYKKALGQ